MSDLFSWADAQDEPEDPSELSIPISQALTVTELTQLLKGTLEDQFSSVLVEGEISNFKSHSSGHFYFSLKDAHSTISAAMFRGANSKLKFTPQDGLKVLVSGAISLYPPRGSYQIIVKTMEPLGDGALQLAFEQLRKKLEKEGLFSDEFKIPLPEIPRRIGIITSPTGAAIRDMLHVIDRRFPRVHITLFPVRVQGDEAKFEIAQAIQTADQMKTFDVLIVGRGGGSLEDLWSFNEEIVARAIFACETPIISAVGHEIDFTISDFVADVRAPTPSAAAELIVPDQMEIHRRLLSAEQELSSAVQMKIKWAQEVLKHLAQGLRDPRRTIHEAYLKLEDLYRQIQDWMKSHLNIKKESIQSLIQILDSLNPLNVLSRGYSVVTAQGVILTETSKLKVGDQIEVKFSRGNVVAQVKEIIPPP